MRLSYLWFCLSALAFIPSARADTSTLYTPAGTETLSQQGFAYFTNPAVFVASVAGSQDGTLLATTGDLSESAGFFTHNPFGGGQLHPQASVLDRQSGFDLEFYLALTSESHAHANRGGFSVIVIAADGLGVEIAFWMDEIWTYDDDQASMANLFTHAEGVAQLPSAMQTSRRYNLTCYQDNYGLSIDGTLVLTGPLRDYRNFAGVTVPIFGVLDPYEVPNMIFLGDDTGSASSTATIGRVVVTTAPESSVALLSHELVGGDIDLHWESLTGLRYQVQSTTDLGSSVWPTLSTVTAQEPATANEISIPAESRRFYRVTLAGW